MNEDTLQLSQDDIRAQEMVFWLKKLSLEIPQAVKPNLDLSAVTTIIEAQTERLKVLEEYAKRQSAAIESLVCQITFGTSQNSESSRSYCPILRLK